MEGLQLAVFLSTVAIALLSCILSVFLSYNYAKNRSKSYLFWAIGMWLFTLGVALESMFALNIVGQFLFKTYLFVVVLIVEMLSLGSAFLSQRAVFRIAYSAYIAAISIANIVVLASANVGNILSNYVVFSPLPNSVVIASSLGTFPAAAVIIIFAALSYRQRHSLKMLSIIAGVIIVSIAGTL
ncbi:MAG: hypothetical protein QW207_03385, partial [Candidatus Micrarchaeaceae archaeon]